MTVATDGTFDWQHEGRLLGETLDGLHTIVVLGEDPTATALVALGIGRAQSLKRRVAIADLLGDAPPIVELVSGDDTHGITDSFSFGVSLNRIAHPVPGSGELFVMPSGTEPLDHASVLPNERWRRLASGFREVGALLVLAAPASAPGVRELAAVSEGAVLVGEVVPADLPVAMVLGAVRAPAPAPWGVPVASAIPEAALAPSRWRSRSTLAAAAGGALAAVLAFMGFWLAQRPLVDSDRRVAPGDTSGAVAAALGAGASSEAAGSIARPDDAASLPVIANPADSLRASAWVVELVKENTPAGAVATLARLRERLPAATVGAVMVNDGTWYRVVGGANTTRAGADSLLRSLRDSGTVSGDRGTVARLPLAFLVKQRVGAGASAGEVRALNERGVAAYALQQDDRTVNIYVGAFETPEEALLAMPTLRQAGLAPPLVHRLGRTF